MSTNSNSMAEPLLPADAMPADMGGAGEAEGKGNGGDYDGNADLLAASSSSSSSSSGTAGIQLRPAGNMTGSVNGGGSGGGSSSSGGGGGARRRGPLSRVLGSPSGTGMMSQLDEDSSRESNGLGGAARDYATAQSHKMRDDHPNAIHHKLSDKEKMMMSSYESLDYDIVRNDLYTAKRLRATARKKRWLQVRSWTTFALIGMTTGLTAFIIDTCVEKLLAFKYAAAAPFVERGEQWAAYGVFIAISLGFGLLSTLLVNFGETVAAGSGIPEVKGYLNGTNYLRFLRLKTGLVKIVGIVFSVSAGLIIGKEGPLIHIGSILAANYATLPGLGHSKSAGVERFAKTFRNDRDKRDFVSGGAAAGVAAAFGSPTGGIMFALEEASSFWSLSLTWKSYLCTMLSTSTLWFLLADRDGKRDYRGLVTFGKPDDRPQFQLFELPIFVLIGVLGGLVGAAFCELNFRLSHWRRDHMLGRPGRRVLEVLICVFLTATAFYWIPVAYPRCLPKVTNWRCDDNQNKYYELAHHQPPDAYNCTDYSFYQDFTCNLDDAHMNPGSGGSGDMLRGDGEKTMGEGALYSATGSIMFTGNEYIIKSLFHDHSNGTGYDTGFPVDTLAIFTFTAFVLAVITYGIAVPSGLFVPCILIGSGYGRIVGELMRMAFGPDIQPGVYALIGAASMLSGVCRITITLTVILYETTDQLNLILPIMATVIVAKWVADTFNISLYDMHIELKCIPFVENNPPVLMESMNADEVMSKPVVTLRAVETIGRVVEVLKTTAHNGFPIIENSERGIFRGLILRNQLIVMLREGCFGGSVGEALDNRHGPGGGANGGGGGAGGGAGGSVGHVERLELEHFAASLQSKTIPIDTVEPMLQEHPPDTAMDLRPYMNPAPIMVTAKCPIAR